MVTSLPKTHFFLRLPLTLNKTYHSFLAYVNRHLNPIVQGAAKALRNG